MPSADVVMTCCAGGALRQILRPALLVGHVERHPGRLSMIYATACFWITISVLLAWGVLSLWLGMLKPKTVNIALLPGTLVSMLGRIVALLITGATVQDAALMKDKENAEPSLSSEPGGTAMPKMPIVGPCLVAMVPMLLLGILIYCVGIRMGSAVLARLPMDRIPQELPRSVSDLWEQFRNLTLVSQSLMTSVCSVDGSPWKTIAFVYLLSCFTIRMAPFPGNIRGHLGAVFSAGMLAFLAGSVYPALPNRIENVWPILVLAVGWLSLLLIISLLLRGAVLTFKAIFKPAT